MTEDNEEEEDDDDGGDTQGRTMTEAGMEVCLMSNDGNIFHHIHFLYVFLKIERASAGNVKLNSSERSSDPEQPDDFGYTQSKLVFFWFVFQLEIIPQLPSGAKEAFNL